MRAAVIRAPNTPPAFAEFDDPQPAEGRTIVSLVATGLHPLVRQLAEGTHYGSDNRWPRIPGVDAVARNVDGALVYTGFVAPPFGTFAERMSTPTTFQIPLPAGGDPLPVAAGLNPGMSSWLPLVKQRARADLGTVLVVGATGVAGRLAVQNARALGVRHVIAAGRSVEGLRALREAGATAAVRLSDPEALASALTDHHPDLVLDYVWGAPAEAVFAALTRSGLGDDPAHTRYVQLGDLAGSTAAVPAHLLRSSNIEIVGSGAGSTSLAEVMEQIPCYLTLIAEGTIRVPVKAFPLREIAAAWNDPGRGYRVVVTENYSDGEGKPEPGPGAPIGRR